jgi:hypothetical protein
MSETPGTTTWRDGLAQRFPTLLRKPFALTCGDGWQELVLRLFADLDKMVRDDVERGTVSARKAPHVFQVKEKFGRLRVQMVGPISDEMFDRIEAAVAEAAKTCEVCGAVGHLSNIQGWWGTRCDLHPQRDGVHGDALLDDREA